MSSKHMTFQHKNSRPTVLVVDDQSYVRELIKNTLSKHNYSILEASNGEEALQILKENPGVNIVILDLIMPGMKGSVCGRIIKNTYPWIKLIVMTGFADTQDLSFSDAFINKPFKLDQLLKLVNSFTS